MVKGLEKRGIGPFEPEEPRYLNDVDIIPFTVDIIRFTVSLDVIDHAYADSVFHFCYALDFRQVNSTIFHATY